MKKVLSIVFIMSMFSSATAFAATLDDTASTQLGDADFKVSTNVVISATATNVAYAAASKHTAGGLTAFGTTDTMTDMSTTDLAADADPPTQADATTLSGF
ncbi:hypothetical protein UWK_02274 [Desulfocapsa sulfexigens DSM 10523]|uniref:Secreted protein n=1 Tax=Desulfocapsa sulfexigens (strain DSM 10523 / SB164P1) TaxID=1167006 RepID=M1NGQ3_DESSD|nr:hypothetical protein [Desulfocapsa sulfexigens]AGF78814.1 hypothetical protein UWK_02274 [Desulfocapsa sulfexigens DSM 10523]